MRHASERLERVLKMAPRYHVLPCLADKSPSTKNGHLDASNDPDEIRQIFVTHPWVNIGVRTGDVAGFDVLDIDPKNGGDFWYNLNRDRIPLTRVHKTQSGGMHIFFRHRPGLRSSAGKVAPGVDIRADGAYVIWWPSSGHEVKNAGILADWPDDLIESIDRQEYKPISVALPIGSAEIDMNAKRIAAAVIGKLKKAKPGEFHDALRSAAATLGGLAHLLDIEPEDIVETIVSLVMEAGADDQEKAEKTARWAVERGMETPLNFNP
jgi:hypothetical protein